MTDKSRISSMSYSEHSSARFPCGFANELYPALLLKAIWQNQSRKREKTRE
jgi:hypothetical protein